MLGEGKPEGVEVGRMLGRTLAVIGLERTNHVLVYDVTDPYMLAFIQILLTAGDEASKGLRFVETSDRTSAQCC